MPVQKGLWSDGIKWMMNLIASLVVAGLVAWFTTTSTLESKMKEGQAVFDNIGIRYFAALAGAYNQKTREALPDDVWNVYRKILTDLQEDIRWLRMNPLYGEIQRNTKGLAFVQNLLIAEAMSKDVGLNLGTLNFMCSIFVESEYWPESTEDAVYAEVRTFAERLCEELRAARLGEGSHNPGLSESRQP